MRATLLIVSASKLYCKVSIAISALSRRETLSPKALSLWINQWQVTVYYTAGNNECRAARIDQAVNKFIEGVNCLAEVLLTLTTFSVCVCGKVKVQGVAEVVSSSAVCQLIASLSICLCFGLGVPVRCCVFISWIALHWRPHGMANQVRTQSLSMLVDASPSRRLTIEPSPY